MEDMEKFRGRQADELTEKMKRKKQRSNMIRCIEIAVFIALVLFVHSLYYYADARAAEIETQRRTLAGLEQTLAAHKNQAAALLQALAAEKVTLAAKTDQLATLQEEAAAMAEILQWELQTFEVTHYAPLDPAAVEGVCYSGNPGITASGAAVEIGTTAAAAWSLPYGTRLYIPGYGFRVVQDRGGDIVEGRLDIAVASKKEAYQLGRKPLPVYIAREV